MTNGKQTPQVGLAILSSCIHQDSYPLLCLFAPKMPDLVKRSQRNLSQDFEPSLQEGFNNRQVVYWDHLYNQAIVDRKTTLVFEAYSREFWNVIDPLHGMWWENQLKCPRMMALLVVGIFHRSNNEISQCEGVSESARSKSYRNSH